MANAPVMYQTVICVRYTWSLGVQCPVPELQAAVCSPLTVTVKVKEVVECGGRRSEKFYWRVVLGWEIEHYESNVGQFSYSVP